MSLWQTELSLDFGELGDSWEDPWFRLRMDARGLVELIEHAHYAHRVYELSLITRPGDVWDYVWVTLEDAPDSVIDRVSRARKAATPAYGGKHPWPAEACLPFMDFDRLFYWSWEDPDPIDDAWLNKRDHPVMQGFATQLLAMARDAYRRCHYSCRELHEHERARILAGTHPDQLLPRKPVRSRNPFAMAPNLPKHTKEFYQQLTKILRDPELCSAAYHLGEDYRVLALLGNEQRRRAERSGHSAAHCLAVNVLGDRQIDNAAWDTSICFYQEGLGHGDLLISNRFRDFVGDGWRVPQRYILSARDDGALSGYTQEAGEGWVLYRKENPGTRREGMKRADLQRGNELGAVLRFGETGPALLSFENACFALGEAVSAEVRQQLATILAEWERHGGTPQVFAQGDVSAFRHAGCQNIFPIGPDALQLTTLDEQLTQHRRWTDALFALECPVWMNGLLARHCNSDPWRTWVVRTGNSEELPGDLILPAEALAVRLAEAWQQAGEYRKA